MSTSKEMNLCFFLHTLCPRALQPSYSSDCTFVSTGLFLPRLGLRIWKAEFSNLTSGSQINLQPVSSLTDIKSCVPMGKITT